MFTIILKDASPNKLFNEIEVGDDFCKINKTLQLNYAKASHFNETMGLMEHIFSFPNRQLALFLANSFKEILAYLNIDTEILISSDLSKDNSLKGKDKIIDICHLLKADEYYNAIGGQVLYDRTEFEKHGIKLSFINTIMLEYPQQSTTFIPNLSIIDVLMNNSKEEIHVLLNSYKLEK